jgi:hypothetical protein
VENTVLGATGPEGTENRADPDVTLLISTPGTIPPEVITTQIIHLQALRSLPSLSSRISLVPPRHLALSKNTTSMEDTRRIRVARVATAVPLCRRIAEATMVQRRTAMLIRMPLVSTNNTIMRALTLLYRFTSTKEKRTSMSSVRATIRTKTTTEKIPVIQNRRARDPSLAANPEASLSPASTRNRRHITEAIAHIRTRPRLRVVRVSRNVNGTILVIVRSASVTHIRRKIVTIPPRLRITPRIPILRAPLAPRLRLAPRPVRVLLAPAVRAPPQALAARPLRALPRLARALGPARHRAPLAPRLLGAK